MEYQRKVYLDKLIYRKQNGLIKVITGARRAGKSYLMNELFYRHLIHSGVPSTNIIRFAFDADEDIDLLDQFFTEENTKINQKQSISYVNSKKFRAYIKGRTNDSEQFYLLLDEVQLLENFTGTLNGFLRHSNFDIYVTGSNSKFLSSDIATEFKGRGSVVHVLPLSFSEYVENSPLSYDESWKEYIITGGIPLVAKMKNSEERVSYLKNLCDETYLKDIIEHNGVRKQIELADTFNVIASMIGTPVNISKLTNTFKSVLKKDISLDTVNSFIEYFENAFVISKVNKYNIKGRRYVGSPFKLYFEDLGVRNARLNFRQNEETHMMENIIYNELRYRGFNVDIGELTISEKSDRLDVNGKNIYVQKSLEVDFIATKGSQKFYIQSALSMNSEEKQIQEKKSLFYIDDSFKKLVITRNRLAPSVDENGIITVDLFDFLMNPEILS